jgi:carboxylesterase type B
MRTIDGDWEMSTSHQQGGFRLSNRWATLLSQRMTDYWTNFAKTRDPNGPGLPAWPEYDTATESTLTLDDPIGVESEYHVTECSLLDTLPRIEP